jgi:hypothetical protein
MTMNLQTLQDLLARLYTDPELRRAFLADPAAVALEFGIDPSEASELAAAAGAELEYFARTLLKKRMSEVKKLLPDVSSEIGDRFDALFAEFAAEFVPDSSKKHLLDAYQFALFLIGRQIAPKAAAADRSRLAFYGFGRRIVINHRSRPFVRIRIGKREFSF